MTCEISSSGYFVSVSGIIVKECGFSEFPQNSKCTACSDACLTCTGNPFYCTSCKPGFLLSESQSTCLNKCLTH